MQANRKLNAADKWKRLYMYMYTVHQSDTVRVHNISGHSGTRYTTEMHERSCD